MSQNKDSFIHYKFYQLSSVFSHVWLSTTQWLSGCETCMSISNSWSLLKLIELVMPHNHLDLCRSLLLLPSVFPSIRVFSNDSFFTSDGQNIGASASVLSMNIQDWSPLRWSGLICLKPKRLSRVFSNTTVRKHQFVNAQFSLWSNFHICMWLPEKPQVWVDWLVSNVSAFYNAF